MKSTNIEIPHKYATQFSQLDGSQTTENPHQMQLKSFFALTECELESPPLLWHFVVSESTDDAKITE